MTPPRVVRLVAALLLAGALGNAEAATPTLEPPADAICAAVSGDCVAPPYVGIVTAFPAELAPLVAAAQITEAIVIEGRTYYVGTLARTPVVLVRGGIGFVNAIAATRTMIDRFQLSALLFSGVANSRFNIGDVTVPAVWTDGTDSWPVDAAFLGVAQTLASPPIVLETCTPLPPSDPPEPGGCIVQPPEIVVGGQGRSDNPYGETALPCVKDGGPIFGCDLPMEVLSGPFDAIDQETAAVAKVAAEAGVRFIAFRGASDNEGETLTQFYAYYQVAADNAAAVAIAFLEAQATGAPVAAGGEEQIGAACDWWRAAGAVCTGAVPKENLTARVDRACGLAKSASAGGAAAKRARKAWKTAAKLAGKKKSLAGTAECKTALVAALRARSQR